MQAINQNVWRPVPFRQEARVSPARHVRLSQPEPTNYVTTKDLAAFFNQANSSLKVVADIAYAYGPSQEERRIIESEMGKVRGFTIPMAEITGGQAMVKAPGTPWLLVGGALAAGALVGYWVL